MKLKTLIYLEGAGTMAVPGNITSQDTELQPYPGSMDDVESWDGVKEGKDWFLYRGLNNWNEGYSTTSVCITEDDKPHKYWINIKTRGLRKSTDTNASLRERIKKHSDKVSRAWMTAAKKLHNNPEINEAGNEVPISWKQAFKEALNDPKVKPYLMDCGEITGYDKKSAAVADPINFTKSV